MKRRSKNCSSYQTQNITDLVVIYGQKQTSQQRKATNAIKKETQSFATERNYTTSRQFQCARKKNYERTRTIFNMKN